MPEGDILTGPVELLKGISSLHFTSHQNNGNRGYRIDFRNEKHPFCEDLMVQFLVHAKSHISGSSDRPQTAANLYESGTACTRFNELQLVRTLPIESKCMVRGNAPRLVHEAVETLPAIAHDCELRRARLHFHGIGEQ